MKIFELTRVRLTARYVLIIMTISFMFSLVIYNGVIDNIESSFVKTENRFSNHMGLYAVKKIPGNKEAYNEIEKESLHGLLLEEFKNSKDDVLFYLLIVNLIIFILSTLISYYLAEKTLLPIEEIIDEQKRFVADASHELKTPLTSLKTSIEVSMRGKELPIKVKELLRVNLEDVNTLNKLIDRLLSLANKETIEPVFDNLDIKEVLESAVKKVSYLSKEKKIKINLNTKNYQLIGDEISLTELFVILLDNAVKYSQKNSEIKITTIPFKKYLIIRVQDSGIGISEKYLSKIFDRFYRIDSSRTHNNSSGFGLGLSMAKKIVENHCGVITVSSEIAIGTIFTIKLPYKS